ncbi:GNAT family N-acetyltransferase [Muricoccus radiodurans]|uniref:GNAT family N-acetyltransferase n=1 Tax=Muricoccus radiodurans TaxID=2231721 RepID=UPI003CF218C8
MSALRPARPEEVEAIAALTERAYAHYVPILGRRPAPMDDDFAARVAAGQAYVLERNGAIVALAVIEDHGDHLWIDNLAVDPALNGQGVGQVLLAFCEAEARRRGYRKLGLLTNERMTRNRAIYARYGFTETEHREVNGFRRVYMHKLLEDRLGN